MQLDETVLQSRTTLALVEFIDELYELLEDENVIAHSPIKWNRVEKKYNEIKIKSEKAKNKRSFP